MVQLLPQMTADMRSKRRTAAAEKKILQTCPPALWRDLDCTGHAEKSMQRMRAL